MGKTSPLGKMQKKCDRMMQEIGKLLHPKSLLSGLPTQVMHHLVPKSVSSRLRYDWENLIPLTHGEHMRLHQSGDPHYEWSIIEKKGGKEWYETLRKKGREIIKVNKEHYTHVEQELTKLFDAFKGS